MPTSTLNVIAVEYAPGRVVEVPVTDEIPRYCVARLVPGPGGVFRLAPISWGRHVRLTLNVCKDLGLPLNYHALRRLIKMGAVAATMPTPQCTMIDIQSLWDHLHATRLVPGEATFWTREKRDAYASAFGALSDTDDGVASVE